LGHEARPLFCVHAECLPSWVQWPFWAKEQPVAVQRCQTRKAKTYVLMHSLGRIEPCRMPNWR
jgi:hypothetical protein